MNITFPWGKYKGWFMEDVPSKPLRWTAENYKQEFYARAADVVWRYREETSTHFEEEDITYKPKRGRK